MINQRLYTLVCWSHRSLEDVTLDSCDVNLVKVFLFGIKDKLNMKKVNVDFSKCSSKCIVIKVL